MKYKLLKNIKVNYAFGNQIDKGAHILDYHKEQLISIGVAKESDFEVVK